MGQIKIEKLIESIRRKLSRQETILEGFNDLADEENYHLHALLLKSIGDLLLGSEFRKFEIDKENKNILKFLLYYFNRCKLALDVFLDKDYKLHKNIMIIGDVGTGKSMLMQIFSEYLMQTKNPMFFYNLSVTQMTNYYKIHGHLDKYTYNEDNTNKFEGNPYNVCLNDIGLKTHLHYGTDTKILTEDFLHARNEIWTQTKKFAHITTNLTPDETKQVFQDGYGRLIDRFKTYNVITMTGDSRR